MENPRGYAAFVYLITNLDTGRMYVGKKILDRRNRKPVKGKKRRVVVVSDSDWRTYYGSSEELLKDVALLGIHRFKREILHLCATRAESSYLEAKEQFDRSVLLDDGYYNNFIGCKVHGSHVRRLKLFTSAANDGSVPPIEFGGDLDEQH